MSKPLADRVALITGSESGIGQSTAIEMAKAGADVVVHYFSDQEGAEKTRSEIENLGRKAIVAQADQREEKDVERLFDSALAAYSRIDILVNNAGIDAAGVPVADLPTEKFDALFKTDVYGPFFCSRRFVNEHKRAGMRDYNAKIINITSVHDEMPRINGAEYDAAKSAMQGFTRTLALEGAPLGINVVAIGPGMILTPINQDAIDDPALREKQAQDIPLKRAGEPWEVGRLAVYLAPSDADYITGTTIYIDGGLMINARQGA